MAINPLLIETTADNMLKILKTDDYECAILLHEWAKKMGCKITPGTGAQYYRIQYNTVKTKRNLFTIECNEKRWRIKANLYHLNQYSKSVGQISEKVKESLITTRNCSKCNSRCIGGAYFILNEKTYFTCIGSYHLFEDMSKTEWIQVKELLKLELNRL